MSNEGSIEVNKMNVTPQDVDIIVQKATSDPLIKVLDYKLVNRSGDILGFTSSQSYLKINIQRPKKETQETLTCFVKSFQHSESLKTEFLVELSIFDREIFFYNTIIPLFTSNFDVKKWSATCFLTKENTIVLEDLSSQGYQIYHTCFDRYEMLKSAVTTVASFHSGSILADSYLNRALKHPIPLNERFPSIVKEVIFSEAKFVKGWFDSSVIVACDIVKYLGKNPEDVRQKFSRVFDIIKPSKTHYNVILHSDLWKNNIMFDETKPIPNSVLIDFQTTRYGPMVLDLLQLLHLNSSQAFRAKFEKELVDHYYSVLEETVKRNDPHAKVPTRDEVDLGLQEFRIFGIILSCLYVPTAMLDSNILTKIASNEKELENFVIGARTDFILENFEKDESYKKKVVEAITELIEFN